MNVRSFHMSVYRDNGAEMGKKFSQIMPFNRRLPPLGQVLYTYTSTPT